MQKDIFEPRDKTGMGLKKTQGNLNRLVKIKCTQIVKVTHVSKDNLEHRKLNLGIRKTTTGQRGQKKPH